MIWHSILRAQSKDDLRPEDWEALREFAQKAVQINFLDISAKDLVQELFSDMRDHQKQMATKRKAIAYISDTLSQVHRAIAGGEAESFDDFYPNAGDSQGYAHLKQGVFRKGKLLGLSKHIRKRIHQLAKQKDGELVPVDDMGTIITVSMKDLVGAKLEEGLLHEKLQTTIGPPRKKT